MIIALLIGAIFGVLFKYEINLYFIICFIIVLFILIIFLKKKSLFLFATLILFYLFSSFNNVYQDDYFNGELIVSDVKENYIILTNNKYKFVCYSDDEFNKYEKIRANGKVTINNYNASQSVNSFADFLHKQKVNNTLTISKYEILNKGDTIRKSIKDFLKKDLSKESKEIVSMLFLGEKESSTLYDSLTNLSVVQLFVISGFHLNILFAALNKIFKERRIISLILLLPYCYILNFSIPIIRAWLFLLAKYFHNKKQNNIPSTRVLSLIALLMIIINYTYVFNVSFQLTFITNYVVFILNNKDNKIFSKIVLNPLIIYFSIVPILLSINYEISIVGFLYAYFLSLPVTFLYLLCGLTSIIKVTDPLLKVSYLLFKKIIELIENANITLLFGRMKPYFTILIYLMIALLIYALLIKNKKVQIISFSSVFLLLFFQYYYNEIFGIDQVVFMNVGQGDCTLVRGKHNSYNILVDTGGSTYSDIATSKIIPFLRANGIKSLDAVILTHDDFDHCGALESLQNNFTVKDVINGWEEEYIIVNDFVLHNLNRYYNYLDSDNAKSAVIKFENGGKQFLIMGDAPKSIEYNIMDDYDIDVDVLRIGHHGSKTSTSDELIKATSPCYAIISVGYNYYGHPTNDVLSILKNNNITYYRTDENGNIMINKFRIVEKY